MMRFIPSANGKSDVLHWILRATNSQDTYSSYYAYMKCDDTPSIDVLYQWRNTMNDEVTNTEVKDTEDASAQVVEGAAEPRTPSIVETTSPNSTGSESRDDHVSVPGYNYIAIEAF